jgi:hypothetical protein
MLFAYIGPETMMIVPSVIAGIAGVFMMFGRNIVGFGRGVARRIVPGARRTKIEKPNPEGADEVGTPTAHS